jgi:hypothetical protein
MKAFKHLSILMLALCCSYFTYAQCPNTFTDTVTGNKITVNVINGGGSNFEYAWYLDGTLVQAENPNTSYVYQNVYAGTHRICMYVYENNTFLCDSACQTVTVTSCGTLTAYWLDQVGTNDTVRFTAYDTNSIAHHYWNFGDGSNYGSGTTATHVYSAPGTYTACLYAYIPGTLCSDTMCRTVVVPAANQCGTAALSCYVLNDSTIRGYRTSTGTND